MHSKYLYLIIHYSCYYRPEINLSTLPGLPLLIPSFLKIFVDLGILKPASLLADYMALILLS
jgi:hypothetical protein